MDPLIKIVVQTGLSILLAFAASHKILNRPVFYNQLSAYQLLPFTLLGLTVVTLPLLELSLATALLIPFMADSALAATGVLFAVYAIAMVSVLVRELGAVDCGCGGVEGSNAISFGHVLRNVALLLIAGFATLPTMERTLSSLDWFFGALMLITFSGLYHATNQLLANGPHIRALRGHS